MKKIKVEITYSWEINSKEWNEGKSFVDNMYDLEAKANFDAIDALRHLNQIKLPDWKVKVSEI